MGVGVDVGKKAHLYIVGGAATLESSVKNPQKTWNGPTFRPSYPTPWFIPKGLKISIL